jgi:two-component system phosphate regulon sensor histidine kinase PhoR
VSALRDGQFVRVTVADTGIGIPEASRARIFERFYRVDKARSRELGGTGLGLSIVRHLVESLAGEIDVESTPGVGSRFSFTLPVFFPRRHRPDHQRRPVAPGAAVAIELYSLSAVWQV